MMASANTAMMKDDRDEPFFYLKGNHLDFGDVPDFLPALHPAEEMQLSHGSMFLLTFFP
jgi:hypothetical protein